jgi:hypothetical protein
VRLRRLVENPDDANDPSVVADLVDVAGERVTPLVLKLEEGRIEPLPGDVSHLAITAFSEALEVWADEGQYEKAQRRKVPKIASTAFIPVGLFENASGRPQPYAFMTGIVRETEERTSSITNKPFTWALVETYGGCFDVLATKKQVRRRLGIGSVIAGQFWLIGRLKGG